MPSFQVLVDKLVNLILVESIKHSATRVIIDSDGDDCRVTFERTAAESSVYMHPPRKVYRPLVERLCYMAELDPAGPLPQAGSFRLTGYAERSFDVELIEGSGGKATLAIVLTVD